MIWFLLIAAVWIAAMVGVLSLPGDEDSPEDEPVESPPSCPVCGRTT